MTLSQVQAYTGLTRKAVEYYAAQGLIAPAMLENGYRDFSLADAERLREIAVYRKLGLSVAQIRDVLAGGQNALGRVSVERRLRAQREAQKDELLQSLAQGMPIGDIASQIDALSAQETVAQRLLEAFPGIYGQYFALHFSHFLTEPIETDEQREAYETIVAWLDTLTPPELDDELRAYIEEASRELSAQRMEDVMQGLYDAVEQPEAFFSSREEIIRNYLAMKETEAYKASPAARLMEEMKRIQQENGYVDVFLPALRRLSPKYACYRERLDAADEAFREKLMEWEQNNE